MPFAIVRDDITHVKADAIVNAANENLWRGGGVCGAIFEAAGVRRLQAACDQIGHCSTGSAVATPAFALPARYVIHAVGPVWQGGTKGEQELLASCYRSALELALELACTSIAFPLISAGIYGYPKHEALKVAQDEIRAFLDNNEMDVTLVLYDSSVVELADDLRLKVARYIDDVYVGSHARYHQRLPWENRPIAGQFETASGSYEEAFSSETILGEGPLASSAPDHMGHTETLSDSYAEPPTGIGAGWAERIDESIDAYTDSISGKQHETPAPPTSGSYPSYTAPDSYAGHTLPDSHGTHARPMAAPDSSAGYAAPSSASTHARPVTPKAPKQGFSLPNPLRNLLTHLDASFSETLLSMIDERNLRDAEVYKRANISRQHFSKMRSNPRYKPTKQTVLALAVALELTLEETQMLLERAGFALSHADQRDIIVEFFIREGTYDVFQINEALFAFDQPLLG